MGFFSKLLAWFSSGGPSRAAKAHPDLRPIDTQKLSRELNLKVEGVRLGEAGVPAADAVVPSGPEQAVIQRVEKARQDYVDWAVLRLGVLNQNIAKEDVTQDLNRARQADQEFVRKASSLFTERDTLLKSLAEAARARTLELQAFKNEHGLSRAPRYPEGFSQALLRWSILVLIVVLEGLVNANFFAQGLSTGLIGGAFYAMSLALLNVSVAFAFGRFPVRFRAHKNLGLAGLGWLAMLVAFGAMCVIGLAIAHFRDALNADMPNAATAALQTLKDTPFALRDLMSWGLLCISLAFGVTALFDGLLMDDPYPGYGPLARAAKEAVADYEEELDELREELEDLKEEELNLLDKTVKRAEVSVRSFAGLVEDKKSAKTRLQTAFSDADNALAALLHEFRTENEVARRGLPRPAYFDKSVDVKPVVVPEFAIEKNEEQLAQQQREFQELLSEFQDIRARIQAAFNQQFDRLKPLDLQFASGAQN